MDIKRHQWRRSSSPCISMSVFRSATLVANIYIHWRARFFFLIYTETLSQHSCIRIFSLPFHVTFEVHLLCFMALNFSLSSMSLPMEAICNLSPFISSFVSKQQQERILTQSICITGLWWAWHRSGSRADCVASVGSRVSEENHWRLTQNRRRHEKNGWCLEKGISETSGRAQAAPHITETIAFNIACVSFQDFGEAWKGLTVF